MRKHSIFSFVFIILLVISFGNFDISKITAITTDFSSNLIVNGGFESGDLTGWTVDGGNSLWWSNNPKSSESYEGSYRIYIEPYGHSNVKLSQNISLSTPNFELSFAILPHIGYSPGDPYHPREVCVTAFDSENNPLFDSE